MKKIIHYCWFGDKKLPKDVLKCIETWKKFLPDYEIKEWNETNFDIHKCKFVEGAYNSKKWAFVSDYVRIYALCKYGGIYFDTDLKILKPIDDCIDHKLTLGFEDSGYVGTAIMATNEENNKYLKEVLDYYDNIKIFNPELVFNYANPLIITKILRKYKKERTEDGITIVDNECYIYPRDYFFPLSYDYSERIFTKNTRTVHLFKATWTSRGERRTIGIYRKFGPKFGKVLNNCIDGIFEIKARIKKRCYKIYKFLRLKASIYVTRKRRIFKIRNEINEIKDEKIVITHPDNENLIIEAKNIANNNILYLREQYTQKEAKSISKLIVDSGKKEVIFNSFWDGWDMLISNIKDLNNIIKIKVIIDGNNVTLSDEILFEKFDKIIELYQRQKIDLLGSFGRSLSNFLTEKGFECKNLYEIIDENEINPKETDLSELKIGIFDETKSEIKNAFNQLEASSKFDNSIIYLTQINYGITKIARFFGINLQGDTKSLNYNAKLEKIKNQDINLFLELDEKQDRVFLESLNNGVLALTSNKNYFEGYDILKDNLVVQNPNDYNEIYDKMKSSIENKDEIFNQFIIWRKKYLEKAKKSNEEFLRKGIKCKKKETLEKILYGTF